MNREKSNKVFLINAILFLLLPLFLGIFLREELSRALVAPGEGENTYWIIGLVGVIVFFSLLAWISLKLRKREKESSIHVKRLALLIMPFLLIASIGLPTLTIINYLPAERGPYLSWAEDPKTTMTITWELQTNEEMTVYYRNIDSSEEISINVQVGDILGRTEARELDGYYHYTVTLRDLKPNTMYTYRIPGILDEEANFRTAQDNFNENFTFIAYGDSREVEKTFTNQHIPLVKQMMEQISPEDVAYIVNSGDIAVTHNAVYDWTLHFDTVQPFAQSVPYFVASGNHEWNPNVGDFEQEVNFIHNFPRVDRPSESIGGYNWSSYAFAYGSVYNIIIGQGHTSSLPEDKNFLNWLDNQLLIGNSTYKFTFVYNHVPPFDIRDSPEGPQIRDNVKQIEHLCPMLHLGGVDAVILGHQHALVRNNILYINDPITNRNITYLTSGGGGASLRTPIYGKWENNYTYGLYGETIVAKSINHFYTVDIDGTNGIASFTAFDLKGNIVDDFSLHSYKN